MFIAGDDGRRAAGSGGSAAGCGQGPPRCAAGWRAGSARVAGRARVGPRRFFPPETEVLEEGEGELAQERVVVQAAPAPALEMVQPQLLLELLVHLLAD